MTLAAKVEQSKQYLSAVLPRYRRPVIFCSFGKDSMVMLHLLRGAGYSLPVVFYTDPWFPEKYAWARNVIASWGLEVHDYPPAAVTLTHGKEIVAFTNHYQIGAGPVMLELPKNIEDWAKGKRWVCGLELLNRPTASYNFPWDAALIGHKDSDSDQIAGSVKLKVDVKLNAGHGPDGLFPLKHWTDDDVWAYTEEHEVPQQWERYDQTTHKERPNKWANSDYANVCINCCDCRVKADAVPCPKLKGLLVPMVTDKVPYRVLTKGYYGDDAG